ncbi:hypothetical protein ALI144C_10265 [Actinosynnema sp. ALI-1.44]|uniref:hypothetical protein n=1 Tax=Actinosynnema sp. ALI-1.44 TaxID=1933779 RepID=UPI00097BAC51|nr:hypothetical protein [Actinosynnema sp. ALI-1.44]ONI87078.1 hypothetical protein ALI144C_10265 [Actinosynnema sp. ALI-1.44]
MAEPPRPLKQRKTDALGRLETDKDLWIASGAAGGMATLVPLSFWWDGNRLFVATVRSNPTARNVDESATARVVLGHTRDVVLIDVDVVRLSSAEATERCAAQYAKKCGWDPLESSGYAFFQLTPSWIESWRELNEHADRKIMADGKWLV